MSWLNCLHGLFSRQQISDEIEEELRSHMAMRAEDNQREGMDADDAARDARLRFGNPAKVREHVLGEDVPLWLHDLAGDLRYSLRQLRGSPVFTLTAVLTLALGIGASTAIFSMVQAVFLRALPYPHADKILQIRDVNLKGHSAGSLVSGARYVEIAKQTQVFDASACYYFEKLTIAAVGKDTRAVHGKGTCGDFWKVYGATPVMGRVYSENEDQPQASEVAVISYELWQSMFGGDPKVIGSHIELGSKPATIIGVMPASFSGNTDLWHPSQMVMAAFTQYRGEGSRFLNVTVRLRPESSFNTAQSALRVIAADLQKKYSSTDGDWTFEAVRLRDQVYGSLERPLLVLMAASGLLLIIACINIAALMLSRSAARETEMAMRQALGASRLRLLRQYAVESLLLSFVGAFAGLATAASLLKMTVRWLPGDVRGLHASFNAEVVLAGFALSLLSCVAFALAPALHGMRLGLSQVLKRGERQVAGAGQQKLRSTFVVVQISLSAMLLVGAVLLTESLWRLQTQPFGFQSEHVLTFTVALPWGGDMQKTQQFYDQLQHKIAGLPGVAAAGQISALPLTDFHLRSNYDIDGRPRTLQHDTIAAEVRSISAGYLSAMRIPLLAGRSFNDKDVQDSTVWNYRMLMKYPGQEPPTPILVNETLVSRYFSHENPVGKLLMNGNGSPDEIVGVVADVRGTTGEITGTAKPEVYYPANGGWPQMTFAVRSNENSGALMHEVRSQLHELDSTKTISDVKTLDAIMNDSLAQPRLNMALLVAFGLSSLLLASIGVFGIVHYGVTQRRREVGVRLAVGASRWAILMLFLRGATRSLVIGLAAGLPLAWILGHAMTALLFKVNAANPLAYAAAAIMPAAATLVAALLPGIFATRIAPAEVLRAE